LAEDIRTQAEACGHVLEDLLPEFRDAGLREYFASTDTGRGGSGGFGGSGSFERPGTSGCRSTPPRTPSTRPPSSCGGMSGCSTPDVGLPPLPLGRALGMDALAVVAEGIREALETEQESLLGLIAEQLQRFEWEDERRTSANACSREPSTAELQILVRKMQELAVSPSLRSLTIAGSPTHDHSMSLDDFASTGFPQFISGGSNVRRLKALIAQRRRDVHVPPLPSLGVVPEANAGMNKIKSVAARSDVPATFDPFFGDPFE